MTTVGSRGSCRLLDRLAVQVGGLHVADAPDLAEPVIMWVAAFTVFAQPVGRSDLSPLNLFLQRFILEVRRKACTPLKPAASTFFFVSPRVGGIVVWVDVLRPAPFVEAEFEAGLT